MNYYGLVCTLPLNELNMKIRGHTDECSSSWSYLYLSTEYIVGISVDIMKK